jgi:glucosamine--fructose-6-phosphate aminotransferase (isomerizing)
MCGIIARVGDGNGVDQLLTGLQNLEYRGYDSAGIAVRNGHGVVVRKQSGKVDELTSEVRDEDIHGDMGIGHTRWSTHGPPTDENAHPHTAGRVAVVHNGVIDNYDELRETLAEQDHEFTSDTDTEVVPHLVEYYLDQGLSPEPAFRQAIRQLEGSYAIAALVEGADAVFAARSGSPLVVGLDDDEYFLASDVPAFLEETDRVTYLEDGDLAVMSEDGVRVTTIGGEPVDRETETVEWDPEETGKGTYDHFMEKEIHAQPNALENTIQGRIDADGDGVDLDGALEGLVDDVSEVQFVACGTSYHAALFGEHLFNYANIRARAHRASEYLNTAVPVSEDTLVIAVTQSGETADTLGALDKARDAGAKTLAVTNVVGSTAARQTDESIFIRAGPEIGVAATKTFSSQVVTLAMVAERMGELHPDGEQLPAVDGLLESLRDLPEDIETMLGQTRVEEVAERYLDSEAFFFIGRGVGHPVAKEGALKFKEITYEHAEGFASGELKHGPLALVTPNTPVFAVCTGDDSKTLTNAKEAQARGADVVAIAPPDHEAHSLADESLEIPETHPVTSGLLANVQLQLVSYYTANSLERDIDKPRNLAKSVTVE